jgi:hypothetical protein
MNKDLDRAAMNHTTLKVSSNPPNPGRIVFHLDDGGHFHVDVTNAGVSYSQKELEAFGEMIMVLKEEGQVGNSGTIPIANLLKM